MARNIPNDYSPSPIYGIGAGFSIADLDSRLGQSTQAFLSAVTTNTRSAAVAMGCHSIVVGVSCPSAPAQTCTINVYTVVSGVDTLVYTFTNAVHGQQIYVGNNEGVDLGGLSIKLETAAMSGAAATSVSARGTS